MRLRHCLFSAALALASWISAQPTWRFHIAFENGDGARDTIWMVFDTSATTGSGTDPEVDTLLGEGAVEMDTSVFNVWLYNWNSDSTKTTAWPYSWFPQMEAGPIYALHAQAPITIRWDTSLFHAPYLPGPDSIVLALMESTHFFFYNNDPWHHAFNMMLDDTVVVLDDEEVGLLFAINVGFLGYDPLGLPPAPIARTFSAWPDPLGDGPLQVRSDTPCELEIFDQWGQLVLGPITCNGLCSINLPFLKPGSYLLRAVASNNWIHHAKLIK